MKIIESNTAIKLKIFQEIERQFNAKVNKNKLSIQREVQVLANNALRISETYSELIHGQLKTMFGFPGDPNAFVDPIVDAVVSGINVVLERTSASSKGISGGIKINLYRGASQLLLLPQSIIKYEDYNIPWLKWLLTEGDAIIISGFSVKFEEGAGRSGGGIMVKNNAGMWRVPPEHSGTVTDNWITKTLTSSLFQKEVENIIKRYL